VQGVVKFAVEKSNTILTDERKRLVQLSDQVFAFSARVWQDAAGAAIHRHDEQSSQFNPRVLVNAADAAA
jgi:hypothetical protein